MKSFRRSRALTVVGICFLLSGCYTYHDRKKVLIPDIDIDATLDVAELEIQKPDRSRVLTLWAVRDQVLTPEQAKRISDLYFKYIDEIDSESQKSRRFAVWHLTWAISNIYRQGELEIKEIMSAAYRDAANRVDKLGMKIATTHFYDDEIYMGDVHVLGRSYAKSHLVVPGNEDYLQSVNQYEQENSDDSTSH